MKNRQQCFIETNTRVASLHASKIDKLMENIVIQQSNGEILLRLRCGVGGG